MTIFFCHKNSRRAPSGGFSLLLMRDIKETVIISLFFEIYIMLSSYNCNQHKKSFLISPWPQLYKKLPEGKLLNLTNIIKGYI